MIKLYLALGAIALAAGILFYGIHLGKGINQLQVDEKDQQIAELIQKQQEKVNEITQKSKDEIDNITRDRDRLAARLRQRPSRPATQTARANCKGASGAELSREDANFLVGEAARADRQRAALSACYDYADTLQSR